MLACMLDASKYRINVYERNAAAGRKFLVAGDGGLNITHSEDPSAFVKRYTPSGFLDKAFFYFDNKQLVEWLANTGIPTFTGSSGRVFPVKTMKPAQVLNQMLQRARANGAQFFYKHTWTGFTEKGLLFRTSTISAEVIADVYVYCLGGASWPVTGSMGEWLPYFSEKNIAVEPFEASNCAFNVTWPGTFITQHAGKPLKNITVSCDGKIVAGEIVLTKNGLEGSGIYPLSPQIRNKLKAEGFAEIELDLKPALSQPQMLEKINAAQGTRKYSDQLRSNLNLTEVQMALLKSFVSKDIFLDPIKLSESIKKIKISITGTAPVSEAISTVGGISLSEVDDHFALKKMKSHYAIGEMLSYDAPTGGYLLQSCFSMAACLAAHLNGRG